MRDPSPGPWSAAYVGSSDWHIEDIRGEYVASVACLPWEEGEPITHEAVNAKLIAAAPDLLKLAFYAASRGEGDSEMAREILRSLGYCAVCRYDRTDVFDCTCGRVAFAAKP